MTEWLLIGLSIVVIILIGFVSVLSARVAQLEQMTPEPSGCSHPETKNVGTFGMPAYECVICHQIVELP